MTLLEAEVHTSLRGFLREQNQFQWLHHLTMGRIVSRALRLQRPALIQTGSTVRRYCLSYLTPALLSDLPVLLVVPSSVQQRILQVEIPQLQQWLQTDKEIRIGDKLTDDNFQGLILTEPQVWLEDRLENLGHFPRGIPTLIDGADSLQEWTRQQLTFTLQPSDWESLIQRFPEQSKLILDSRIQLTKAIFERPKNPYECYYLEEREKTVLQSLFNHLNSEALLNSPLAKFWQRWQLKDQILWASVIRETGQFTLHIAPAEVATVLSPIWQEQPVVLIGGFLDKDKNAPIYRQQIGLGEVLCLKFSPHRQTEHIKLYLPERLPLPNTPQFQGVLIEQIRNLIYLNLETNKPIIILLEDVPLKAQIATILAAQFGSRVQVENPNLSDNTILITGWQFWKNQQEFLPTPQLLIIATLPIPSLENPLVAGLCAYYKSKRQDWFRCYLLPTALQEIQRAVIPLRESQGIVALLDNRVNYRSYGSQILTALEPYSRINYLDSSWLE
jgi:ATP-dependent DNA helicase DinG